MKPARPTFINMTDRAQSHVGNHARFHLCILCHDLNVATAILRAAEAQAHMRGITISAKPRVAHHGDVVHVVNAHDLTGVWQDFMPADMRADLDLRKAMADRAAARGRLRTVAAAGTPRLHLVTGRKSRIDTAARRR